MGQLLRGQLQVKLRLVRQGQETVTLGDLYVDGVWQCYTLEDVDRRLEQGCAKIRGQTAIPLGLYRVTIDFSARFQRPMLHVLDVCGFAGIRVHAGNGTCDTEGCILVGQDINAACELVNSRLALDALVPQVQMAIDWGEEVTLSVERGS